MICCGNRFICYLIFDKKCSMGSHTSAKQSITLKRTSPLSQGCCSSRLGHPMKRWFEIYLPSTQPESWTLWQKRHPFFFPVSALTTLLRFHFASTLPPFPHNCLCASMMWTSSVNGLRKCIYTIGWGRWKCLYTCRIHSIISFLSIEYKRLICQKGFKHV